MTRQAINENSQNSTKEIQERLDQAGKSHGTVRIGPGRYLVGSLFIPSHVTLILEENAVLLGSPEITDYSMRPTRVAGIDMTWPLAILNVYEAENVIIKGKGMIDGQGQTFWEKFWGKDSQSGMMADYADKGLRWAADYDCKRPRNICLYKSSHVRVEGITSIQSGFWNTQLSYCENCQIDGITVKNGPGPSTDGIDIDSSHHITVKNCYVECNDDNICIKAGRGREAFDKKTTCSDILISACVLGKGSGVTIGSETSGGISDITISGLKFKETGIGFRIKSANNRGGYIKNITISDLTMEDVFYPFNLQTNWYEEYSYAQIPPDYTGVIPDYWEKIKSDVTGPEKVTAVDGIHIDHVKAKLSHPGVGSRAFYIQGNQERPIHDLTFSDCEIKAQEFGKISGVKDLQFQNVLVSALEMTKNENDHYER